MPDATLLTSWETCGSSCWLGEPGGILYTVLRLLTAEMFDSKIHILKT